MLLRENVMISKFLWVRIFFFHFLVGVMVWCGISCLDSRSFCLPVGYLSFPNYPLFQGSNQLWKSGDWGSCWHRKQCTSPNYLTSLISWTTRKTDTKQGHYKNTKSYEITPQKYLQSALLPKLNVPFNKMFQSQGFHFRFSDGEGGGQRHDGVEIARQSQCFQENQLINIQYSSKGKYALFTFYLGKYNPISVS